MQEKIAVTYTRTLDDSLDFLDKAIDASDTEKKRREAEEARRRTSQQQQEMMVVDWDSALANRYKYSRERNRSRQPPPYPDLECPVCFGRDPACPHKRRWGNR